jgi:hypothetical protein
MASADAGVTGQLATRSPCLRPILEQSQVGERVTTQHSCGVKQVHMRLDKGLDVRAIEAPA